MVEKARFEYQSSRFKISNEREKFVVRVITLDIIKMI